MDFKTTKEAQRLLLVERRWIRRTVDLRLEEELRRSNLYIITHRVESRWIF